ncbi:ABC transporter ATP-binding protein [Petrotoga sp. 9PWA.NaAc.5.4]|uniref:ABC transporter ATP-binding protein n=1 Tax=Petrotoga sp. 9PWA.NaAc.5.4 TaxID=1434328 RepID=UPI000CBC8EDC|nr:ABC transporter ATP-binding protein [Petrotoga sp. 9PWA.NaAc.5.4]PNR95937.1 ABC transporter ATP-binding protein [Petrotoga sp. 9PWA.NaAc.5.4]
MKSHEYNKVAIEIKDVTKRFGKTVAVDNVSLQINKGEIFGLIGPNGAGKSTIMKMISTLLYPTSGKVAIFGTDISKNKTFIRKIISLVSDYSVLEDDLTPYENLKVFSIAAQVENAEAKIEEFLNTFGLNKYRNKLTKHLSSGNKQKLNVARALLKSPEILLLDEPTNAIDVESSRFIRRYIINENINKGTTIVITSHHLWEVEQLATNIGIIIEGKLVIKDNIDNVYNRFDSIINIYEINCKKEDYENLMAYLKDHNDVLAIKPISHEKIVVDSKNSNFKLESFQASIKKIRPTLEDIYSYVLANPS